MKNTKKILRTYFLQQRQLLTVEEVQQKSEQIALHLYDFFVRHKLRVIHCFLPIQQRAEVNTFLMIRLVEPKGIQVVIPKVNIDTQEMDSYLWCQDMILIPSKWGVPEPQKAELFEQVERIDCVVTPLLAYDNVGYRVGYGKGFYDRFFRKCRPDVLKVGVSFFGPVEAITDIEPHDVRLNACITPEQLWWFE